MLYRKDKGTCEACGLERTRVYLVEDLISGDRFYVCKHCYEQDDEYLELLGDDEEEG